MILTIHTAAQIQDQNDHAALEPEASLRFFVIGVVGAEAPAAAHPRTTKDLRHTLHTLIGSRPFRPAVDRIYL